MITLREHLDAILDLTESHLEHSNDPVYGHDVCWNHAREALAILDAAEADMFDDETGMVALVPDGTVWHLTPSGWMREVN